MNRATRRSHGQRRGEHEPTTPFARLMRPCCSVCSKPVRWMSYAQALDVLGLEQIERLVAQLGPDTSQSVLEDSDVWKCTSCDQRGLLLGDGGWL